jgi:hypothetical protein
LKLNVSLTYKLKLALNGAFLVLFFCHLPVMLNSFQHPVCLEILKQVQDDKINAYCAGTSVGAGLGALVGVGATVILGAGILTGGFCAGSCADG